MGALAEFERSLIVERTQAGLQAARKRGVRVERPLSLAQAQVKHARKLIDARGTPCGCGIVNYFCDIGWAWNHYRTINTDRRSPTLFRPDVFQLDIVNSN